MGKRDVLPGNNLTVKPKKARDFYGTIDPDAVKPLAPFISGVYYYEPCRGDGDLTNLLIDYTYSVYWAGSDISDPFPKDALTLTNEDLEEATHIITNPPFTWSILEPMINHFMSLRPTWLLLPADMMHNKRMGPYMEKCKKVVSVGRLCWFPDETTGKMIKGTDNYAWYLFDDNFSGQTEFYGRIS